MKKIILEKTIIFIFYNIFLYNQILTLTNTNTYIYYNTIFANI